MKKNTPLLWDRIWKQEKPSKKEYKYKLLKEESSIRWQRIEKYVLENFESFHNLNIIEIGAGTGTVSALMAKRGAKVTVLDYSQKAIQRSREFFKRNRLPAKFIVQDATALKKTQMNKYDISMSFGLAEHFKDKKRVKIIKAHFDLLKKGGITFISVPNAWNLPYRIFKICAEVFGLWKVGEEYPFTRKEFRNICKMFKIRNYFFFGDRIFSSLNFVNPLIQGKKLLGSKKKLKFSKIKKEKGTFLDEYLSYALVLYAKK